MTLSTQARCKGVVAVACLRVSAAVSQLLTQCLTRLLMTRRWTRRSQSASGTTPAPAVSTRPRTRHFKRPVHPDGTALTACERHVPLGCSATSPACPYPRVPGAATRGTTAPPTPRLLHRCRAGLPRCTVPRAVVSRRQPCQASTPSAMATLPATARCRASLAATASAACRARVPAGGSGARIVLVTRGATARAAQASTVRRARGPVRRGRVAGRQTRHWRRRGTAPAGRGRRSLLATATTRRAAASTARTSERGSSGARRGHTACRESWYAVAWLAGHAVDAWSRPNLGGGGRGWVGWFG